MRIILGLLLLFVSCSKTFELESYENTFYFNNLSHEIVDQNIIEWKAGLNREKLLSKGFSLSIELNEIETKTKEFLSSKYRVDSWIFKFYQMNPNGRKNHIGYVSIPFDRITRQFKKFNVIFYYMAASFSRHYREFKCPAFNHRKRIENIFLEKTYTKDEKIFLSKNETIEAPINNGTKFPITFNLGDTLLGNYFFEVALFSTTTNTIYSKWLPGKNFVKINDEKTISVPTCIGIKEENTLPSSPSDLDIKKFEIK